MKKWLLSAAAAILCAVLLTGGSVTCFAAVTYRCLGDMDGNGAIQAGDARIILRAVLGLIPLSLQEDETDEGGTASASLRLADLNGDGAVTFADIGAVLRVAAQIDPPRMPPDERQGKETSSEETPEPDPLGEMETDGVRSYRFSDMTTGQYYSFSGQSLTFNHIKRAKKDPLRACLLLSVSAGETVVLKTRTGSSSIRPYGLISSDRLIYEVYDTSDAFDGEIPILQSGWIAINVLTGYEPDFVCDVRFDINTAVPRAIFENGFSSDGYVGFPVYDDDDVCRFLQTGPSMMGSIHHWAIIGASFDSGEMNYNNPGADSMSEVDWYEYSCWEYLKTINGIPDLANYSAGGQNARDWIRITQYTTNTGRGYYYDSSEEEIVTWKDSDHTIPSRSGIGPGGGCWWKMREDFLNGDVKQAYVVNLGSNDINLNYPHDKYWNELTEYDRTRYYTCGTVDDIGTYDIYTDTDTVPAGRTEGVVPGIVNSYAAYIGAILNRILAIQPNAVIFLATIRNGFSENANRMAIWNQYNDTLKEIAALDRYKEHVYILDNGRFGPNYAAAPMTDLIVGYHPNVMGYRYLAYYWNTLIDYTIQKHYQDFALSGFIGTGKRY